MCNKERKITLLLELAYKISRKMHYLIFTSRQYNSR
jgi:hypothetical protein